MRYLHGDVPDRDSSLSRSHWSKTDVHCAFVTRHYETAISCIMDKKTQLVSGGVHAISDVQMKGHSPKAFWNQEMSDSEKMYLSKLILICSVNGCNPEMGMRYLWAEPHSEKAQASIL